MAGQRSEIKSMTSYNKGKFSTGFIVFCFWATPSSAQGLLLALFLEVHRQGFHIWYRDLNPDWFMQDKHYHCTVSLAFGVCECMCACDAGNSTQGLTSARQMLSIELRPQPSAHLGSAVLAIIHVVAPGIPVKQVIYCQATPLCPTFFLFSSLLSLL